MKPWLVAGLIALPLALQAQRNVQLGIELGYTRADFINGAGIVAREGATAGAFFRIPLGRWLSIQPGLLVASKGGASDVVVDTTSATFDFDLVYLDLPLLLRARVPFPVGTRLILAGGVAPGVRIGCNLELRSQTTSLIRESCAAAHLTGLQDWDVALVAGAGLGIPIEKSELAFEIRYSAGRRPLSGLSDIRNRSVTLLVSVPF